MSEELCFKCCNECEVLNKDATKTVEEQEQLKCPWCGLN